MIVAIAIATVAAVAVEPSSLEKRSYYHKGCKDGHIVCHKDGFRTCDHGRYVYRKCGYGTACVQKKYGKGVFCDYNQDDDGDDDDDDNKYY